MKTLYLECNMGAAGDMLTAALLELVPDRDAFINKMNSLGLPGVAVSAEKVTRCGILATSVRVSVDGKEEKSEDIHTHHHDHEHEHHHHDHEHHHHEHEHHHSHTSVGDIEEIISHLDLSDKVKSDAFAVYRLIAEAESHAHGKPIEQIHFHEVGTLDAVADVVGVCLLMEQLAPQRVVVSPVHVGSGFVKCAHGTLPVPAPATAYILRDVPIYGGSVEGELCTPTGAALLKTFADSFGDMPAMRVASVGLGAGKKDFNRLNCVRAFIGESDDNAPEQIAELVCDIDDMTGEDIAYAVKKLYEGGAAEAFTTAVNMKKGRPGIMLTCLCPADKRQDIAEIIFRHTSTIGVREHICTRYTLKRREELCDTPFGSVRVKTSEGFGVTRRKPEHDDLALIADREGKTIGEIRKEIE